MNSSPGSTMTGTDALAPSLAGIEAAAARIAGQAIRTPLLESPALNQRLGGRVFIKPETLQRTGSFKFRGAFNRISQIPADQRPAGVVAYSSGNHAQGVAAAAALLEIPATIVMPADAPKIKIANTKNYGAKVVTYDRYSESREEIGNAIRAEQGATLVPPFDDPEIIAGQGTCGLEIAQQSEDKNAEPDQVLINCGGGGLIAGCSLALKSRYPACKVYAVEPEDFDDTRRSLMSGRQETNRPEARSICDALLSPSPGALTLSINKKTLSGALTVSDDEVRAAMRFAFRELKLVVEPGGAVTLAALLNGRIETKNRTTAIVLSGGNVDPVLYSEILAQENTG